MTPQGGMTCGFLNTFCDLQLYEYVSYFPLVSYHQRKKGNNVHNHPHMYVSLPQQHAHRHERTGALGSHVSQRCGQILLNRTVKLIPTC